eukprot:2066814-Pyramimonas_sp.AAC.2
MHPIPVSPDGKRTVILYSNSEIHTTIRSALDRKNDLQLASEAQGGTQFVRMLLKHDEYGGMVGAL